MRAGATALLLGGSYARGEAGPGSDIDLWAVGKERPVELRIRRGRLVTVSWDTVRSFSAQLRRPAHLGGAVPGCREAVILHDPRGIARRLQARARSLRWESVDRACDRWVAGEVVGYAEEVGKLTNALTMGDPDRIDVERSVLSLRLPYVASVHYRVLYGSENRLRTAMAERLGRRWERAQSRALHEGGRVGAMAALEMYQRLAVEVGPLLNREQTAVVRWALHLIRASAGKGSSTD